MYTPAHYKVEDPKLISKIINEYGFATMITHGSDGLEVSHLPLILEGNDNQTLLGHAARANTHWKQFTSGEKFTSIFHGPHSYISPAWYEPKPDNVPTWSYASVHVEGTAKVISKPADAYEVLRKSVVHFENSYQTGWSLPAELNAELTDLLKAIVVFRIDVSKITAKFKLNQKQSMVDRESVIRHLPALGDQAAKLSQLISLASLRS